MIVSISLVLEVLRLTSQLGFRLLSLLEIFNFLEIGMKGFSWLVA